MGLDGDAILTTFFAPWWKCAQVPRSDGIKQKTSLDTTGAPVRFSEKQNASSAKQNEKEKVDFGAT